MIEYIRGTLVYLEEKYIVVETGGVGYQIFTGNPFQFQRWEGEEILVYTYQHVREDILALYGFKTKAERELFIKLQQVSGIGPKGAMGIVSMATPTQLALAVQQEDLSFLTKLPGVGQKTARRLIVDLKDKLNEFTQDVNGMDSEQMSFDTPSAAGVQQGPVGEAIQALEALGYTPQEVGRLLPELLQAAKEGSEAEQLIKIGLKLLAK